MITCIWVGLIVLGVISYFVCCAMICIAVMSFSDTLDQWRNK